MPEPTLLLVHEREQDCRARLVAAGLAGPRAAEVASYLAQSTDMEPELAPLEQACAAHGIGFAAQTLDEFARGWDRLPAKDTLVWPLTDGIAFFSGSLVPALARLGGLRCVGAESSLFALCQDKFRSGAVLEALGLRLPATALARDGAFLSPSRALAGAESFFVKPNRLGAKIGIYAESHGRSLDAALALSRRIFADYGDDAVVQAYVPGVNLRVSWLDVDGQGDLARLGIWRVAAEGDYQSMADSLALYGATGAQARQEGRYREPELVDLRLENPAAAAAIVAIARTLMQGLGLAGPFSLDLRLGADGTATLLEFEVCPGLPCFDFRAYLRAAWGMSLAEAMAATAACRLAKR